MYCDDFDDSNAAEYWFIRHNESPRIFQKAQVISCQEIPRLSEKTRQAVQEMGENYEQLLRSKRLHDS